MSPICLYQILLLCIIIILLTDGVTYYIKPLRSSTYPEECRQCLTLSQFIAEHQTGIFREPSVSLTFLSGNHTLNEQLNIRNVTVGKLSAYSFGAVPAIVCKQNASIMLSDIDDVHVSYMDFIGCSGHKFNKINMIVVEDSAFINHHESALTISLSNIKLVRTLFNSNSGGSWQYCSIPEKSFYALAGAAIVSKQSNVSISESVFMENVAEVGGAVFAELHSKISVMHTVFERNHAACKMNCVGGALYIIYSSVSVCNSTFYSNKLIHSGDVKAGYIAYGGVIGLLESTFNAQSCIFAQNGQHGNGLGGVLFAHNATIIITNSQVMSNYFDRGVLLASRATITIMGSNFIKNDDISIDEGN